VTRSATLALIVAAAVAMLTACTTAGTTPASSNTGTSSSSAAAPAQAAADGSAGHPFAFGQTWQPPGKMKISVSTPAPYTPSSSAFALGGSTPRAVVVEVSVTNVPDGPAVPAMVITVQATAGDRQAQQIEDSAQNVGSPTASIAPGKTLTWKAAFGAPAGAADFTVVVGALGGGQDVYFTGKI